MSIVQVDPNEGKRRMFGGKLNYSECADKGERKHEKKHLKAYLQGKKHFTNGWEKREGGYYPIVFAVQEIWVEEKEYLGFIHSKAS